MIFGLMIQAYRERAHLSVRQLAKIMGVEHSKLWRFENGKAVESASLSRIISWSILTEHPNNKTPKGKK